MHLPQILPAWHSNACVVVTLANIVFYPFTTTQFRLRSCSCSTGKDSYRKDIRAVTSLLTSLVLRLPSRKLFVDVVLGIVEFTDPFAETLHEFQDLLAAEKVKWQMYTIISFHWAC